MKKSLGKQEEAGYYLWRQKEKEGDQSGSPKFGSVGIQNTMWKTLLRHSQYAEQSEGNILIFITEESNMKHLLNLSGYFFALFLPPRTKCHVNDNTAASQN